MTKRSIPIQDDSENNEQNEDTPVENKRESDGSVVNSNVAASAYKQQSDSSESAPAKKESDSAAEEKAGEEQQAASQTEEKTNDVAAEKSEDNKEEYEAIIAELKDRVMRQAAEFDNFRKRTQRERGEIINRATARLVEELLPVLDNLKLAFQQDGIDTNDPFFKGMELVHKHLKETLKKHGLVPIEADGEHFNPEIHEALMSEPTDEYPEDTVIQVLQDGYTLNGSVIRPARVKVARAAE